MGNLPPILIPIIIFMIPIIAILTNHQRKMAELIHGHNSNPNQNPNQLPSMQSDTSQLREEVRQLRELMNQQAIALDNLRDDIRSSGNVQARISDNS